MTPRTSTAECPKCGYERDSSVHAALCVEPRRMAICSDCGCALGSVGHERAHAAKPQRVVETPAAKQRSISINDDHQLCALCGLVWNRGRATCPPNLRSEGEERLFDELRKRTA